MPFVLRSKDFGRSAKEFGRSAKELGRSAKEFGRSAKEFGRSAKDLGRSAKEFGRSAKEFGYSAKIDKMSQKEAQSSFYLLLWSPWRAQETPPSGRLERAKIPLTQSICLALA